MIGERGSRRSLIRNERNGSMQHLWMPSISLGKCVTAQSKLIGEHKFAPRGFTATALFKICCSWLLHDRAALEKISDRLP